MKTFIYLFLLLGMQNLYSQNFKNYCNLRFNFCVSIPKDFKGLGESENGDGQGFLSKDKNAKISTFGNLATDGINDLETRYKENLNSENITYKFRKANFFIVSGIQENGKIFYIKSIQKKIKYFGEMTDVVQTLMITYPKSQHSTYSSYCKIISKSF